MCVCQRIDESIQTTYVCSNTQATITFPSIFTHNAHTRVNKTTSQRAWLQGSPSILPASSMLSQHTRLTLCIRQAMTAHIWKPRTHWWGGKKDYGDGQRGRNTKYMSCITEMCDMCMIVLNHSLFVTRKHFLEMHFGRWEYTEISQAARKSEKTDSRVTLCSMYQTPINANAKYFLLKKTHTCTRRT